MNQASLLLIMDPYLTDFNISQKTGLPIKEIVATRRKFWEKPATDDITFKRITKRYFKFILEMNQVNAPEKIRKVS